MAEKLPLIGVKATASTTDKKTKGKVVLWERNDVHPPVLDEFGNDTGRPHEALVSVDGKAHQVAETKEVRRLIGEGVLERVNWNSLTADEKPKGKGGRPKKNGGEKLPDDNPPPDDESPAF